MTEVYAAGLPLIPVDEASLRRTCLRTNRRH